ncbi:MAG: glycosyltransferase family 2 protein [Thermoleophilia bacterium]
MTEPRETPDVSVVVPSYGCAQTLTRLVEEVSTCLGGRLAEVVIVDDSSPDEGWEVAKILSLSHRVRAVRLSRNFGQHAAITAGLEKATGQIVVVMDCDMQDPPDVIPSLVAEIERGHDVVLARRQGSPFDSRRRRLFARAYVSTLRRLSGAPIDPTVGSFSAIRRPVVDAFLQLRDLDRHYLYVLMWLGFDWSYVEYERPRRPEGKSSYSFRRRISHALEGVAFFGTRILRFVVATGLIVLAVGVVASIGLLIYRLTHGTTEGWTSLLVVLLLLGGGIFVAVGTVGLYVGRVYEQTAGRPIYVVREDTGAPLTTEMTTPPPPRELSDHR